MRWGLLHDSSGLHNIWQSNNTTATAAGSLGVVALFAALMAVVSVRVFTRAAVH